MSERRLRNLESGAKHPFGKPTKFVVVENGRQYAPKAVIGLAAVLGYCLWGLIMAAGPLLYVSYYFVGPSGTILSSVVLVLLWTLMYFWARLLM